MFIGCKLFTLSNCIKLLKDFYFTYVLRSLSDSKFYVGFTSDLMQRFDRVENLKEDHQRLTFQTKAGFHLEK